MQLTESAADRGGTGAEAARDRAIAKRRGFGDFFLSSGFTRPEANRTWPRGMVTLCRIRRATGATPKCIGMERKSVQIASDQSSAVLKRGFWTRKATPHTWQQLAPRRRHRV